MIVGLRDGTEGWRCARIVFLGEVGIMAAVAGVGILRVPLKSIGPDWIRIEKIIDVLEIMVGFLVKGLHDIWLGDTRASAEGGGVIRIGDVLHRARPTVALKAEIIFDAVGARDGCWVDGCWVKILGKEGVGIGATVVRRWFRSGNAGMHLVAMAAVPCGVNGPARGH